VNGTVYLDIPCDPCGFRLVEETREMYREYESGYFDKFKSIEEIKNLNEISQFQSDALTLFSRDSNWIVHRLNCLLAEGHKNSPGSEIDRIYYLNKKLNYFDRISKLATYSLAWTYEDLGDVYSALGHGRIAVDWYERSYWVFRILCGDDHPFSEGLLSKWQGCVNPTVGIDP
jgi:hypothetical protein